MFNYRKTSFSKRTEFTSLKTRAIPSFKVDEMLEATSTKESGHKLIKTRNPNKLGFFL